MPVNYLKSHYLEDHKLAQRALVEFRRALKSGRMIAFTGSMTTEAFGYGSWDQLQDSFVRTAGAVVRAAKDPSAGAGPRPALSREEALQRINEIGLAAIKGQLRANVAFSLIEEVLDAPGIGHNHVDDTMRGRLGGDLATAPRAHDRDTGWPLDDAETPLEYHGVLMARQFREAKPEWTIINDDKQMQELSVPHALFHRLGIRRFATLNYDLELERLALLPDKSFRKSNSETRFIPFDELRSLREQQRQEHEMFSWNLGSGRIRRVMTDGSAAESDILNRERIDRLFEFAVGTDDVDSHIMHLHGRACNARTMIASQRDYDQLYRRNDLNRVPFEFAKRMLMGGNPILFVGIGMSEAEVNREMEDFISNQPYHRVAPIFLLWNQHQGQSAEKALERRTKRLDWLHRLGVIAIFDSDLDIDGCLAEYEKLKNIENSSTYISQIRACQKIDENTDISTAISVKCPDDVLSCVKKFNEELIGIYSNNHNAIDEFLQQKIIDVESEIDKFTRKHIQTPQAQNLVQLINALADTASIPDREDHVATQWRSMQGRIDQVGRSEGEKDKALVLWDTVYAGAGQKSDPLGRAHYVATELGKAPIVAVIGSTGRGKGSLGREVSNLTAAQLGLDSMSNCLLINGSYCFDSDSILDAIARFLARIFGEELIDSDGKPKLSRSRLFEKLELARPSWPPKNALIIFNGMERFFGTDTQILSSELDELFRMCLVPEGEGEDVNAKSTLPKIRWLLLGSERVHPYVRDELRAHIIRTDQLPKPEPEPAQETKKTADTDKAKLEIPNRQMQMMFDAVVVKVGQENLKSLAPARYRELEEAVASYDALAAARISGDYQDLRRAFYALMLSERVLGSIVGCDNVGLSQELLRALAIVGLPVEREIFIHVPRIRKYAEKWPKNSLQELTKSIDAILETLRHVGLILSVRGFEDYLPCGKMEEQHITRYALHRTLLTELRSRFGIPLSEAKLSTAFNMSLYVAQPVDGFIPDNDIHDELGEFIDRLIGAYRDEAVEDETVVEKVEDGKAVETVEYVKAEDILYSIAREHGILLETIDGCGFKPMLHSATVASQACEKPANADSDSREEDEAKALLRIHRLCRPESVQCVRAALAVVRGYYSTTGLLTLDSRDRLIREDRDGILLEHAERLDRLIDAYAKISMARKAMYKEIDKYSKLPHENEKEKYSQSARVTFERLYGGAEAFYPDEIVWLHNERGVVRLAMGDLYEARTSFERAMRINREWVERDDRAHNWRRVRLNQLTLDIESGDIALGERKVAELLRLCKTHKPDTREDELAMAIATGYRGWCAVMRGQNDAAQADLVDAIATFARLNEVRAQAYFTRILAETITDRQKKLDQIEQGLDLAQSARQMDIVYRLFVAKANTMLAQTPILPIDRTFANRLMDDALIYALHTDMHRVRCEADIGLAQTRYHTSDYEGALRFASDALMVATRYGMELHKITLRAIIARIMAARGHPVTAHHMARTSIKIATRQRYQTAIDIAQQVLTEIPRLSKIVDTIDTSGRRDF